MKLTGPTMPEERGGFDYISRLLPSPGGQEILRALANGEQIGLFCTNDALVRGVRAYLDSRSAPQLPSPLHMVGFDGRDFGDFMNPPLVTIKQDFYEIGQAAMKSAAALLDEKAPRDRSGLSKKTSVELLRRTIPWSDLT